MVVLTRMQMKKTATQIKYDLFNLSQFETDFICAGVRENVVGMYRFLIEKGAQAVNSKLDSIRISSGKPIVLLCKNATVDPLTGNPFGNVQILDRSWWDFYHNKRRETCKSTTKTYNLPSQWNVVLMVGCVWKEVEVLIPEVV
jgi:hypothetical protein